MANVTTLGQFIIEKQADFPYAKGELSRLLRDIGIAAKIVNREVNKAGLMDILGNAGSTNIQGESQQKLDVFANDQFISALRSGGECCIVASEENEDIVHIDSFVAQNAKYIVVFDPLDGSSNIDVNVPVGTIFSIFRRPEGETDPTRSVLQPGSKQVAAGYVVYGSSTIFVYTAGRGVYGFTLDPSVGAYVLGYEKMRMPKQGKYYSVNEANVEAFPPAYREYISRLRSGAVGGEYSSRY